MRAWRTLTGTMLCALSLLLCIAASASAKRVHAKRSYDALDYYVLELDVPHSLDNAVSGALHSQAERIARQVDARLVEQVGELQGHFLLATQKGRFNARSSVDPVVVKFEHLKQRRSHGSAEPLSLVKQHPRKRVKRVLAIDTDLEAPALKRRHKGSNRVLKERQRQSKGDVSTYLGDIVKRFSIFDPLFPKQWHIANDRMHENSINVTGVWAQGIEGQGVRVAIVDDGLDMHSDDLASNFFAEGSWDYNDHLPLPEPRLSDDQHGTRCAGEIAAAKNDACGVGVAYEAKVAGIRILSGSISDADEASALNYGYQENDIYSCSWGPPDDGKSCEAPSRLIVKSILNGVTNGRGGKGSIFVFASGNGGAAEDQCNFDGYTNSIYSITVGAIDREGLHPFYSEACSAIMVVTYSSGSGDNIHTTDVGKRTCTSRHGGTSAAAPIAAGIFALVLQVRPDLTWRDMQHLCVHTAGMVNPNDPDWSQTHVGRPFNHKYGYGKLDAWRLVETAKTWQKVKPQAWFEAGSVNADGLTSEGIPDGQGGTSLQSQPVPLTAEGITSGISIDADALKEANFDVLEHVTVRVHILHERRGNIEVTLTSPNGVVSSLARSRRLDEARTGLEGWQFMSVKHWDENPIGTWTLRVLDRQDNDKNGSFVSWSMSLWGSARDASLAKPYKLPHDEQIHLPPSPTMPAEKPEETETDAGEEAEVPESWPDETTSSPRWTTATTRTKEYAKPTEHLPDDHDVRPGHSTLALDPTRPTDRPAENAAEVPPLPSSSTMPSTSSFFGSMTAMLSDRTMLTVGIGSAFIFAAGLVAFLIIRRKRLQRRNYSFERVAGSNNDLPMSSVSPNIAYRPTRGNAQPQARTRDLYDAFGVSSDSESDDETTRFRDGSAIDEFLEDRPSSADEDRPFRNKSAARSSDVLFHGDEDDLN